ncbi:MAG: hypothetical protein ACRED1_04740, partial [Limisphaerales bacterium]
ANTPEESVNFASATKPFGWSGRSRAYQPDLTFPPVTRDYPENKRLQFFNRHRPFRSFNELSPS